MDEVMSATALAQRLADRLAHLRFQPDQIVKAKAVLRNRRDRRGDRPGLEGHEYVVETLLRPVVTGWAVSALDIPSLDLPARVNSSHYHTSDDPRWPFQWTEFKRLHPEVDTHDLEGHSRRGDLFIDTGAGRLVSIDFKYLQPKRTLDVATCVRQLRVYLGKHAASVLVIYAGIPPSSRLQAAIKDVQEGVQDERAFVAVVHGPPVEF